jgi:hypothetical protein
MLTYMATLAHIVAAGHLEPFEPPEWERRRPVRPLLVAPELLDWAYETPELNDIGPGQGRRTLTEHLLQMFSDFRCDRHVHYSDLKRMLPTTGRIWHMYPPGLRIYGWVPAPHSFVAITGALAQHTKDDPTLNDRKRDQVTTFARRYGLTHTIKAGDYLALFPPSN